MRNNQPIDEYLDRLYSRLKAIRQQKDFYLVEREKHKKLSEIFYGYEFTQEYIDKIDNKVRVYDTIMRSILHEIDEAVEKHKIRYVKRYKNYA